MGIRASLSKPLAGLIAAQQQKWSLDPEKYQQKIFEYLIKVGEQTVFGSDHDFKDIANYEDFKARVPLRDYEDLKPYIERVISGQPNVLWKDKPVYFAKTSLALKDLLISS